MGPGEQDYSGLFSAEADEELEDPFADDEVFATSPRNRERRRYRMDLVKMTCVICFRLYNNIVSHVCY